MNSSVMEMRCRKKLAGSEEDYAGCLSALVSILGSHARHNSQKLVSDRKRWSHRLSGTVASRRSLDLPHHAKMSHEDIDDVDQSGEKWVTLGMKSIKTLIKEEMSITNTTTDQSSSMDSTGRSAIDFDLAAFMVEFYCENYCHQDKKDDPNINSCSAIEEIDRGRCIHRDEPDTLQSCKHSTLERALGDMAEVFLRQRFIDSNLTTTNGQVQSKEFMDALEILNSNKELFLKLIQDQKSLLSEHFQEEVTQKPCKKKIRHSLFRKKEAKPSNGSDTSQASTKIVVLKPSVAKDRNASSGQSSSFAPQLYHGVEQQQNSERPTSKFSFEKIKSRLRQVIRGGTKDRHATSTDTIQHTGSEYSCDIGESVVTAYSFQPSQIVKKSSPKENGPRTARESYFYEEARRHLTEMLAAVDEMGSVKNKEVSEQLQNIISSTEFDIVRFSPPQLRFFPSQELGQENSVDSLSPVRQSFGSSTTCNASNVYDESQVTDTTPACARNDMLTSEGTGEVLEETPYAEEQDNLDMTSESNWNETDTKSERCRGEGSCTVLDLGPSDDKPELSITPAAGSMVLAIKEPENLEEVLENPEGPSPVSVLEAVFSEDTSSPRSTTDDYAHFPTQQPKELYSEEQEGSEVVQPLSDSEGTLKNCLDLLGFVTKLLEASGYLSCNETLERWHLPDELLNRLLLEEAGTSLSDDLYLLFDCINEVLAETQERLFGCTPWVSLVKAGARWSVLGRGNLAEEVCKGINRHLRCTQFPNASDELEAENWTDIFETEDIGFEMADAILEETMNRVVSELWV
ncbi:uncharacterized protein M6B38_324920 [Iris pallida]|uniref:DUF4378 domain-containing protein n=1 Tax=Iris pallida TaxID=29817 RepID=A0AAX6H7Z5_IRIPA|nr:uncharacterized protein M6B38_324920 [Iris pallida]